MPTFEGPDFPEAWLGTVFTGPGSNPPWPDEFVIVTAWAPTGQTWSRARNRTAMARLGRELRRRGHVFRPITGQSPDGTHAEPSWLVAAPQAVGVALGLRYGQAGIYWVLGDALHVVRCGRNTRGIRAIGSFRERVRPDHAPQP